MVTLVTADSALKTYYLDAVKELLNTQANPLLAKIRQSSENVVGKDIHIPVCYGVNGGVGAGSETGNLPASASNRYAHLTVSLKNLFGTMEISDKAVRSSATNEGAFVGLLNTEMEGLVRSASFNLGRMLFGDGTGKLAEVVSVSGTTVTLSSVKNIEVGMIIDFLTSVGGTITTGKGRTVLAVNRDDKTISVSGAALSASAIPAGSLAVVQGSYNYEITGLGAIFDTSKNIYGLVRSENAWLNPYIKTAVGTLDELTVQTAIDTVEERSGGKINFIVCSAGVRRAIMKMLSEQRSFVNTLELDGGVKAISFNGIPVVADRFCPDGTMYLLNTDDFTLYQLGDWSWMEDEKGAVLKQVAGRAVYSAALVKYADLVCVNPAGQAMLTGITEA